VLEGTVLFACGETTEIAGPGAALFLPKDVPHVFKNVGDTPARVLLVATPCGFEQMVATCGRRIASIPTALPVTEAAVAKLPRHPRGHREPRALHHPAAHPAARPGRRPARLPKRRRDPGQTRRLSLPRRVRDVLRRRRRHGPPDRRRGPGPLRPAWHDAGLTR